MGRNSGKPWETSEKSWDIPFLPWQSHIFGVSTEAYWWSTSQHRVLPVQIRDVCSRTRQAIFTGSTVKQGWCCEWNPTVTCRATPTKFNHGTWKWWVSKRISFPRDWFSRFILNFRGVHSCNPACNFCRWRLHLFATRPSLVLQLERLCVKKPGPATWGADP